MLTPDRTRKIEALQPDGSWTPCELGHLETGDVFRTTEPDGTPVLNEHGRREYLATDMPRVPVRPLDQDPNLDHLPRQSAVPA